MFKNNGKINWGVNSNCMWWFFSVFVLYSNGVSCKVIIGKKMKDLRDRMIVKY